MVHNHQDCIICRCVCDSQFLATFCATPAVLELVQDFLRESICQTALMPGTLDKVSTHKNLSKGARGDKVKWSGFQDL